MKQRYLLKQLGILAFMACSLCTKAQSFKQMLPTTAPYFTNPKNLVTLNNGTIFFIASDPTHGEEVWVSGPGGVLEGTHMVQDIASGTMTSGPESLTAVGNKVFWSAQDGTDGRELYVSDGTTTTKLNINSTPGLFTPSNPTELHAINGKLYFAANDGKNGNELWVSDGGAVTLGHTYMLGDINTTMPSFASNSDPREMTVVGSYIYFSANNGVVGRDLWVTDGISAVERMTTSLSSGNDPKNLTACNGKLYYSADDGTNGREPWISGGYPVGMGTHILKNISLDANSNPKEFTVVGTTVFFSAQEDGDGYELYKTDGTAAGTIKININSAPGQGSDPTNMVAFKNTLFFMASDGSMAGAELFKSNGTTFQIVKDISNTTAFASSYIHNMTVVGDSLYFNATDGFSNHGPELWVTDSTTAGTVMVKDINSAPTVGSNPDYLVNANGKLFFVATDGSGSEIWTSQGSSPTTLRFRYDVSTAENLTTVGNKLFFTLFEPNHGTELWVSDGTVAGTKLVKDINPEEGNSYPSNLTNVGGTLFFTADNGTAGTEVWKSDGTEAGTVMLQEINTNAGQGSYPQGYTVMNGRVYFAAASSTGDGELWSCKTDGTDLHSVDIEPGAAGSIPGNFTVIGSTLYFTANTVANGLELYTTTDGLSASLIDIAPGASSSIPLNMVNANGTLFFSADGQDGFGREVWKSNGTLANTTRVSDINSNAGDANPGGMVAIGNTVYFSATDGGGMGKYGEELWKSDGTTTTRVSDVNPGSGDANPTWLTVVGSNIYFQAYAPSFGTELFVTDGTNVTPIDIVSGVLSSSPDYLKNVNGTLYFNAEKTANGRELCKVSPSDPSQVTEVQDLNPGAANGNPNNITVCGTTIFLLADGASYSNLLWAAPSVPLPLYLLEFNGKVENNTDAVLRWKTAGEVNTSGFVIERSTNGSTFGSLGTVNAYNTTGTNHYEFTDPNIAKLGTTTLYYRLKMYDKDGRFTYSPIINVSVTNTVKNTVTLYPNPAKDVINLTINNAAHGKLNWSIINSAGQIAEQNSRNISTGSTSVVINVEHLPSGIYYLIVSGVVNEKIKLVKQ